MRKITVFSLILIIASLLAGCSSPPAETGTLEGQVSIGPLQPVVRPGDENLPVPCEVYEARKIMVYDRRGEKLVKQVDIDCEGHYSVELETGIYTVDINNLGIDHSSEVPKQIEMKADETIRLDIDIDTGIR